MSVLFVTVLLFGFAMTGFSLFHVYLVLTNQTTNEFYKRLYGVEQMKSNAHGRLLECSRKSCIVALKRKTAEGNKRFSRRTFSNVTEKSEPQKSSMPYNKGVLKNIVEVVQG